MAKLSKSTGQSNSEFLPVPEGDYQGVVCDVVDLGWIEKTYQGQSQGLKPHVQLVYQVGGVDENDEPLVRDDGKPWLVFGRRYVLSTNERAGFFKELCGILGKKKCDELLESGELDTEELVGKNVNIVVTHREWEGKTFANVEPLKPWNPRHGDLIEPRDYTRRHESEKWVEPEYSAFGSGPRDKTAPVAQKPAEPTRKTPDPSEGEELISDGRKGELRSLARRKLDNDHKALDEFCIDGFGKKLYLLSKDEGAEALDKLRRMKDKPTPVEEEDESDPFADEEEDATDEEATALLSGPPAKPAPPRGNKKADAEAYATR